MVPNGWEFKKLGDLCTKITDGAHHSPKSVDQGYPMYSVKDMSNRGFLTNTARLISKNDYEDLVNQNCKPLAGDVLIAKDGSILKHCFVMQNDCDGVILSSIALLRPNESYVSPHYLAHYFSQDWVKVFVVRALTSGSGVPRIILKDFKTIKIPTPPLPEQQKIAKILTTWDKAIDSTERLIDNSKQQKKALMQQLLTGKKRLLDENGKRFAGEWEEVKLEDICLINPKKPTEPKDGKVSFIPMDALSEDAKLIKQDIKDYKDVSKGFTSFTDNDVLIAKITPCFENGKGAFVEGLTNGVGFGSTEFHVLRADKDTCPKFIYYTNSTK